jgi:hypothetical protein
MSRWIALLVLMTSSPALARATYAGGDDGIDWWRVIAALVLCLLLSAGAALLLRSRYAGTLQALPRWRGVAGIGERRLKLVERLRINAQLDLAIIACDGREWLVVAGQQDARLLAPLPLGDGDPA